MSAAAGLGREAEALSRTSCLDHMEVLSGRCGSCGRIPHAIVGV